MSMGVEFLEAVSPSRSASSPVHHKDKLLRAFGRKIHVTSDVTATSETMKKVMWGLPVTASSRLDLASVLYLKTIGSDTVVNLRTMLRYSQRLYLGE
jgi:hypothetical protein